MLQGSHRFWKPLNSLELVKIFKKIDNKILVLITILRTRQNEGENHLEN